MTTVDPGRVERTANDVVPDAGQVLHPSASHQHHRMLLQVMTYTRDVGIHLTPVRETHTCNLSQRRVRLLGRRREHAQTHAPPLRAATQVGCLRAVRLALATHADQLLDGGHADSNP